MWFKQDDTLCFDPRVVAAGNAAFGLWARAASWCGQQLTDGCIPAAMLLALGGSPEDAQRLVDAGLWEPTDAGWQMDWSEQPSREDVEDRRAKEREKKRRQRRGTDGRFSSRDVSLGDSRGDAPRESDRPDQTRPEGFSLSRLTAGPSDNTCGALTAWLEVSLDGPLTPEEGMTASEMWGKGEPHGFVLNTIRKQRRTRRTS